jgi:hypothetical protein
MFRAAMSVIVGGLAAALAGALLLAVPTYLSNEIGFLGRVSDFAALAALMGMVIGVGPGIVIGLLVAILKPGKLMGLVAGACVGQAFLFVLPILGLDPFGDLEFFSQSMICVPTGAVVGLAAGMVNGRLDPQREPKQVTVAPSTNRTGRIFDA